MDRTGTDPSIHLAYTGSVVNPFRLHACPDGPLGSTQDQEIAPSFLAFVGGGVARARHEQEPPRAWRWPQDVDDAAMAAAGTNLISPGDATPAAAAGPPGRP